MMMKSLTYGLMVVSIGAALSGCATPQASCPAVDAQIPASADAGTTFKVQLENVLDGCSDTGGGPNKFKSSVELQLVSVDTAETVLTTGTSDVAQDGTATVSLAVPPDATGTASVVYDGLPLGTVSITG